MGLLFRCRQCRCERYVHRPGEVRIWTTAGTTGTATCGGNRPPTRAFVGNDVTSHLVSGVGDGVRRHRLQWRAPNVPGCARTRLESEAHGGRSSIGLVPIGMGQGGGPHGPSSGMPCRLRLRHHFRRRSPSTSAPLGAGAATAAARGTIDAPPWASGVTHAHGFSPFFGQVGEQWLSDRGMLVNIGLAGMARDGSGFCALEPSRLLWGHTVERATHRDGAGVNGDGYFRHNTGFVLGQETPILRRSLTLRPTRRPDIASTTMAALYQTPGFRCEPVPPPALGMRRVRVSWSRADPDELGVVLVCV